MSTAAPQRLDRKLRVGLIGAGGIATGAHLPGYKRLLDRVELVAVADVNAERAGHVAREHGFQQAYGDYEEMLRRSDLDAVSVCTPNKFHASASIAALQAGCHVLCEKPPAIMAADVRRAVEEAKRGQRILTYGLNHRFSAEVQAAKRFADGGEFGEIYSGRVTAMRRRGIPGWGVFTNKDLQGGGPLIDIGVHHLDEALFLMGYPLPVEVMGATYQKLGTRPGVGAMGAWDWEHFSIEDLAVGMVRFGGGETLLIETSFAVNAAGAGGVALYGTEGGVTTSPLRFYQEIHGTLVDLTPAWLPRVESTHSAEIEVFVDACRAGRSTPPAPLVQPEEGIRLQTILEGLYRSAEAGRAVTL